MKALLLACAAPAAVPKGGNLPSFVAFVTRSDEWIAIAGSEPLGWALFAAGVVLGFGWWVNRHSIPRRARALRAESASVAATVAKAAKCAIANAHRGAVFSKKELADLQIFYEKWLNLAPDVRDGLGESLRASGIDMIKLGDAIRAHREAPLRKE